MTTKYLLSTGQSTTDVAEYILDLIKVYMYTNPGDIPHLPELGYDFTLIGVTKDRVRKELVSRIEGFLRTLSKSFSNLPIKLEELTLVDEERAKIEISVDSRLSENYYINIYENS